MLRKFKSIKSSCKPYKSGLVPRNIFVAWSQFDKTKNGALRIEIISGPDKTPSKYTAKIILI